MVDQLTSGSATAADDPGPEAAGSGAPEAALDDRVTRLEQLVAALGLLLDRFRGSPAPFGTTVFDRLDDPTAGHAVLSILVASTADAHWDVQALRRAIRTLVADPDAAIQHPLVARLERLAESARELKAGFEEHRISIARQSPALSPNAAAQLHQIIALSVRALLDVSELLDDLRPGAALLQPAPVAATLVPSPPVQQSQSITTTAAEPRRTPNLAKGLPATLALLGGLRRRRNRVLVEAAALGVVALVLVGSVLNRDDAPGALTGAATPSLAPGRSAPDVALGNPSLVPSPAPDSSAAPTPPVAVPTPRPTAGGGGPGPAPAPQPTPPPAAPAPSRVIAAATFDSRVTAAADAIDGLLSSITTAVQASDFAGVRTAAEGIAARARTERAWLQTHPPKPCFKPLHASVLATYAELIATANEIIADADAGDANGIHKDVANSHSEVTALRRDGNKAVAACA